MSQAYKARVFVTLKPSVFDPQGRTITDALQSMGYGSVQRRSGRAPILRRYLEVAGGARAHFSVDRRAPLSEFEAIAPQYPVFRVRSAP